MSTPTCTRLWEVEAARDARLSGDALAKHERHVSGCADCKAEQRGFEHLAQALNAAEPVDQVALRRLRGDLLMSAHSREVPSGAARAPRSRYVFALASCLAILCVIFVATRQKPAESPATSVIATPIGDTTWAKVGGTGTERIVLQDGTLDLSVQHTGSGPRLVIQVPDGEIEDVGTRFQVTVHKEQTRSIVVSEGVVVFHPRGAEDIRLGAGQRWTRPPPAEQPKETVATTPAPERDAPAPAARGSSKHPASVASGAPHVDAAVQSAAAEDAAYLGVLSLLRQGRSEDARSAARKYLTDFPRGFRRVEMERVAREQ